MPKFSGFIWNYTIWQPWLPRQRKHKSEKSIFARAEKKECFWEHSGVVRAACGAAIKKMFWPDTALIRLFREQPKRFESRKNIRLFRKLKKSNYFEN
jgi:hypothetical protein